MVVNRDDCFSSAPLLTIRIYISYNHLQVTANSSKQVLGKVVAIDEIQPKSLVELILADLSTLQCA